MLGLFEIPNNSNLGFSLLENNFAIYIDENSSNIYSLLPATTISAGTRITANSNVPNSNNYFLCQYFYFAFQIKETLENWSFFPKILIINSWYNYEFLYTANKTDYYNLENLYVGWNL